MSPVDIFFFFFFNYSTILCKKVKFKLLKGLSLLLAVSEVSFTISMHDIYKNNAIKAIPKHYLSLEATRGNKKRI